MSPRPTASAIRVDPIACDGHGLCAELFPERIRLDDWGYPIIDPAPIDNEHKFALCCALKTGPGQPVRVRSG